MGEPEKGSGGAEGQTGGKGEDLSLVKRVEGLERGLLALTEAFARLEAAVKSSTPREEERSIPPSPPPSLSGVSPELIGSLMQKFLGGGENPMESLARTIMLARQIADAMNPPSPLEQLFAKAMVRQLFKQGLLTEAEAKHILKEGEHE